MRLLSARAAAACEHATSKRCRCRCGGEYHGAARVEGDGDSEAYYDLDETDPHKAATPKRLRQRRLPFDE